MDSLCMMQPERLRKPGIKGEKDGEMETEKWNHRCGGASGNTSHYGVTCSSGDVVVRAQGSPSHGRVRPYARFGIDRHKHTE